MTAAAVMSLLVSVDVPAHAAAPLPSVHVRGTISDVTPTALTVATGAQRPRANIAQAVGVLRLPDAFRNAAANAWSDWPASGGQGERLTDVPGARTRLMAAEHRPIAGGALAERAGEKITELRGSHAIMISQPQAVTDVILEAARFVSQPAVHTI
jgi:hypothetical protein